MPYTRGEQKPGEMPWFDCFYDNAVFSRCRQDRPVNIENDSLPFGFVHGYLVRAVSTGPQDKIPQTELVAQASASGQNDHLQIKVVAREQFTHALQLSGQ